jgi:acetyltransferase-like isoleucine patch superfamily enzyme
VRRDHRPHGMKKAYLKFQNLYARHFLRPHFERFGKGHAFMKPWNVEVFGGPVELGDFATIIATRDQIIRLSVWSVQEGMGRIAIGSYCLICPGVRISSGSSITIGDNCMMASGVYVTDADWHGIYDRAGFGRTLPVSISDNVWIGDRAMVCKGVSIGENSIIGAGSVVVGSVPANVIAAGNPARVLRDLDPEREMRTRRDWFSGHSHLSGELDAWDKAMLQENTAMKWLRYLIFPRKGD